jgi:hypothetical protein
MTVDYERTAMDCAWADVATMSYGHQGTSPSGSPFWVVPFPTAYRGSAETLHSADALFARIDTLTQLPDDWNTYGAQAPSARVAAWAKRAVRIADWLNISPAAVIPSAENGLGLAFRRGRRYADIEFLNSGDVLAVTSDGNGTPTAWEVDRSEQGIVDALKAIRDYLW